MNKDEKKTLAAGVAAMCEAFNRKQPNDATFKAYEVGLDGLSVKQMNVAFTRALRETQSYMPSPAQLRELAGEVTADDRAVLAWGVVSKQQLNPYRWMDFDDPLINATIRSLGGWTSFVYRHSDAEAEKWVRKEFIDTYRSLLRSGVDGEMCAPLRGLSDRGWFVNHLTGKQEFIDPIQRIETNLPALPNHVIRGPALPAPGETPAREVPQLEVKRP